MTTPEQTTSTEAAPQTSTTIADVVDVTTLIAFEAFADNFNPNKVVAVVTDTHLFGFFITDTKREKNIWHLEFTERPKLFVAKTPTKGSIVAVEDGTYTVHKSKINGVVLKPYKAKGATAAAVNTRSGGNGCTHNPRFD